MPPNRTPATKRACDGCKIRKIRCGGGHPCPACTNARIKCTYIRIQQPRGPQRLRETTKYLIDQAQKQPIAHSEPCQSAEQDAAFAIPVVTGVGHASTEGTGPRIPINILASPLYIYHVRMYPVWPIVDVEYVVSYLRQNPEGEQATEIYALATAIAAATIAQLRLGNNSCSDKSITADTFAQESLRARESAVHRSKVNLNNVRTSFFLHVYYENQRSGGSESLLYLREAISLAQMMHLHRESSYRNLLSEEQQIRRRVLWLLFVTERGVCILHKFPVVLKTNISTPDLDINDEPQVLPAFLKLLNLFRLFEQSELFSIIEDDDDPGIGTVPEKVTNLDRRFYDLLQDNQQDGSPLLDRISDVQKADLCVTRHWMRMILWRFSTKIVSRPHQSSWCGPTSLSFPIMVAKDLLGIVSQLPRTAIEAHGLGMELKLYEIANSLADAVMNLAMVPSASAWDGETRPSNILARLHSILSTFRGGGNKEMVEILYKKMTEAQSRSGSILYTQLKTPRAATEQTGCSKPGQDGGEQSPLSLRYLLPENGHVSTDGCLRTDASHLVPQGHTCNALSSTKDTVPSEFPELFFPSMHLDYSSDFDSIFNACLQSSWETGAISDISPEFPERSPSLPSNPIDVLINDFMYQIPENEQTDYPWSTDNHFLSQSAPTDSFLH